MEVRVTPVAPQILCLYGQVPVASALLGPYAKKVGSPSSHPDQPIVVDNPIMTSYNPSTAFDVAFALLESLTSTENANHVKRLMGFIP